jgi:mannose/fructose/N-acetylgalactosamine-specific phosphotransferase system component IIC
VLDAMKRVGLATDQAPRWLVAGGAIAGQLVPHLGLGLLIAEGVERGVVVFAGDP